MDSRQHPFVTDQCPSADKEDVSHRPGVGPSAEQDAGLPWYVTDRGRISAQDPLCSVRQQEQ